MIEYSLVAFLKANAGVANQAGSAVYPDVVPDGLNPYPAVVVQTISDAPVYCMAGESGLTYLRVQVSSWARTRLQARNLDDAVRVALSGYMGPAASDTIQSALSINRRDVMVPDPENEMARIFGCQRDFMIGFTQQ